MFTAQGYPTSNVSNISPRGNCTSGSTELISVDSIFPDVVLSSVLAWPGYKPADDNLWAIYKGQTLQYKCESLGRDSEEDPCFQHFVLISIPIQSIREKASSKSRQNDRLFEYEMSGYRICWTMVTTQNTAGKDHWTTVDYFSTLEIGSIPDSGTEFFGTLVTTVSAAWIRLFNNIDRHLARCVSSFTSTSNCTRTTLTFLRNHIAPRCTDSERRGLEPHRPALERCQYLDWPPSEAR
jgi:hypothetical protein